MIFRFFRTRDTLRRALQAAVAAHRPPLVRELFAGHGAAAFAAALAHCSSRVVDDALSMLPEPHRTAVFHRLPRRAQACRQPTGAKLPTSEASIVAEHPPQLGLLVWGGHA